MKKKRAIVLEVFVIMSLLGMMSMNTVAGATQWFPEAGTICEYKVSVSLTLNNGTVMEGNLFNIYDYITSYRVVPVLIEELAGTTFSGTLLEENVEVTMVHEYSEESSTQLRRTTTYKTPTMELSNMSVQFARAFNGTYYVPFTASTADRLVDKDNFFTSMSSDCIDHLDASMGLGAEILPGIKVISVTSDAIIAFYGGGTNYTYISGRDGRVDIFTSAVDVTLSLTNQDVVFSSFIYSSWSATTIFDWPWDWIFGISSLVLLIIVILVASKKRK